MPDPIVLLPRPKRLMESEGIFYLTGPKLIALAVPSPAELRFTAAKAQAAFSRYAGHQWEIVGGSAVPNDQIGLLITFSAAIDNREGYRLTIGPERIEIEARTAAGAFYGVMTLTQLLRQFGPRLPRLTIDDWPDLPHRGVMHDISRDKVPTMETLYALVDMLASWKINQFQLYTEHTFAYRNHPRVWAQASPMTAEEIMALDAYCRERFVELVPNQASFGHMHRWFEHEEYIDMAESPDGFKTPWNVWHRIPFSLSPARAESLNFVEGLFAELLPNFTSRMFNVNCDETFDLGQGLSKSLVAEKGEGRVYLDYLLAIYERVRAQGRTMQFWSDIVGHYPELVPELPRDVIALDWWYDAPHEYATTEIFAREKIPFYLCPGTSSWCSIAGRTDNAIGIIGSAARLARERGGLGLLNTDWGDGGHWQQLPVSFIGFAYGAAVSWGYDENAALDLPAALDRHAFEDRASVMGRLAYDLGNVYQTPGLLMHNGSVLWWAYVWPLDDADIPDDDSWLTKTRRSLRTIDNFGPNLHKTLDQIDAIIAPLDQADMARPDAETIKAEFQMTAAMLRHGAKRLLVMIGDPSVSKADLVRGFPEIERRYRQRWLARNRPGGLEDSIRRMTRQRPHYE